ncbi:hypothetical protein DFH09DRAFT_1377839 [Mycena vulgaris]|nr:hypothetical protein DFH09DRAFT_1377839 [Mycena vulgaris]
MYRALRISEILQLIFDEFTVQPPPNARDRVNQPTLAALARTCQIFQNPALDLLWRRQETLINFLDCFPDGLIQQVVDYPYGIIVDLRLLRPMLDEDWKRPLFYSPRVRELSLCKELQTVSWAELLTPYFGHLFPNLNSLKTHPYMLPSVGKLLLSPRIERITLAFGTKLAALSRILSILTQHCPSLTDITISTKTSGESVHAVSTLIRSLTRVDRLSVENLDRAAFEHLGRLPTVKTLVIADPYVPSSALLSLVEPIPLYSSLESLYFGRTALEDATSFMEIITSCPLQILEIEELSFSPTRDAASLFFTALAAHCSHQSLRQIETGTSESGPWMSDEPPIDSFTLRILFCFANLVRVSLPPPLTFDLDDRDFHEMARAWPRLVYLELRSLPHLSFVELNFDATSVPDATETTPCQTSLSDIYVGFSPIVTAGPVAAFISKLFPNADVDCWPYANDLEYGREAQIYACQWEKVQDVLKEMRTRRDNSDEEAQAAS